jgi:hypothetical protein
MTRLYIVRKFNNTGVIDEEGIFDTFDRAEHFVNQIRDLKPTEFMYGTRRIIIRSYLLNSMEPWEEEMKWEYDIKGNLCRTLLSNVGWTYVSNWTDNESKYSLGDIVTVKSNLINPYSNENEGIIGVIAGIPKSLIEWVSLGYSKDEWCNIYLIDYVSSSGYFTHCHVDEKGIYWCEHPIPEEVSILQEFSRHYKGEHQIDHSKLMDIRNKRILMKKIF